MKRLQSIIMPPYYCGLIAFAGEMQISKAIYAAFHWKFIPCALYRLSNSGSSLAFILPSIGTLNYVQLPHLVPDGQKLALNDLLIAVPRDASLHLVYLCSMSLVFCFTNLL